MSYWRLFYHVTWATKDRTDQIQPNFEAKLHDKIAAKATELGAKVYAVGGIENHVHLVASIPPKIALSEFIRQVKGSSSHFVNYELNKAFAWQNEFGVVSFGEKQLDWVVRYVKNQREHHCSHTTQPTLERYTDIDGREKPT
jgi:putative transposase